MDTIPGLIGSANSAGTDGNDTITATNTTLTVLDNLNGGLGNDILNFTDVAGGTALPAGLVISSVETFNIRSAAAATLDLTKAAGVTGVTALNSTLSTTATLTAADTTDISVSGATGAIAVNGGKNVTVNDVTADQNIDIGATTVNAGTITVTDTKQGNGTIKIDGGTAVTVTATADQTTTGGTSGTITVGDTGNGNTKADMPTGAISVTQNLNSDGTTAALTGGAISVEGGTTVDVIVNATSNAKAADSDFGITIGQISTTAVVSEIKCHTSQQRGKST